MSTTLNQLDSNEYSVSFSKIKNEVVNSIRRVIIDEVPTFAIENVEITVNESPLYDETLAHRLGLIPLKTNLKDYNKKSECKCGGVGCALCEVTFSLEASKEGYVYSKELKSDDPQVFAVDEKIPVTKLFGDKKLSLKAKANLGTGREHAKWAPAHAYLREADKGVDLMLELHGQLSVEEMFNEAIDILVSKIEIIEEKL